METLDEHYARIVPHGPKCHGCIKGDPHGIVGYTGNVFCHLLGELMEEGNKECGINEESRMKTWISIAEETPPTTGHTEEYLVELENGDHVVANWMNIGGWDFEPESPITHWMPIPPRLTG